jgi:hypothetical protein
MLNGNASWQATGGTLSGGTTNYIPKWTSATTLSSTSLLFDNGTNVGVGTATPYSRLDVVGTSTATDGQTGVFVDIQNSSNTTNNLTGIRFTGSSLNSYKKVGILVPYTSGLFGISDMIFALNNIQNTSLVSTADARMIIKSNGNVGIGTINPAAALSVSRSGSEATVDVVSYSGTSTITPSVSFKRARGTEGTPAAVQSGDLIGSIDFFAHTGSSFAGWGASITAAASGTHSGTSYPTNLTFHTTNANSTLLIERMRINASGNIGIGTINNVPSLLTVGGNMAIGANYTTTAAPTNGLIVEGNVGIGIASASNRLSVVGNSSDVNHTSTAGIIRAHNSSVSGGVGILGRVTETATNSGNRTGVSGIAWWGISENTGLYGWGYGGTHAYGIYAQAGGASTANWAGYFAGSVHITGSISKGSGTFKIDHPLDPENKYLYHSFVESPDMMNIYNGNITTDASGIAVVALPAYFEALNKDFRYQLTVISTFAQAIVLEKVNGNKFSIKTDKPNVEVSWQVTGVRKDPFANQNRVIPEVDKPHGQKGKYLHPEAFGLPASRGTDYNPEMEKNNQRNERDK